MATTSSFRVWIRGVIEYTFFFKIALDDKKVEGKGFGVGIDIDIGGDNFARFEGLGEELGVVYALLD